MSHPAAELRIEGVLHDEGVRTTVHRATRLTDGKPVILECSRSHTTTRSSARGGKSVSIRVETKAYTVVKELAFE